MGKTARNHCNGGWVDPREILDAFHGIENPLHPPGGGTQTAKQ